ncbi:rod shape-determining protein MreC [Alkalilimnicola sp. S0819]|nr:rod shape-determining protein MreC [Alkalilimnicola sp. S0819]MPQ16644.1 rod shape-determining protein MreC [Alkalilimnicola sp. S0819]
MFQQGPSLTARVIFFSVISVVLMTLDHRQHLAQPIRESLAAAVYPIRLAVDLPGNFSGYLSENLASRRQLIEENARLRDQQLLHQARLQKMDALEVENIRLRDLLDSSYQVGESVLIAELMRVDLDPFTHLIQIDKGASSEVFVGQPVLDAHGIMGQVNSVGPFSAMVRLITDPGHAIPVQVNRNGVRSIALGTGDLHRLELSSLPNNADIRPGDLLVSSGLAGRFPQGYPIARVETVHQDPGRPFAQVTAAPTAALDRSREVLLVRKREQPGAAPTQEGP